VRPGRAADNSPPSSAAVMEEYSYTSTHPLGHIGPVTGSLYLYLVLLISISSGAVSHKSVVVGHFNREPQCPVLQTGNKNS